MRLWTTQTQAFWDQLQDRGRISCESEYAESLFLTYYDWLSGQMCRRIGPPPESGFRFPIWAWKQQGSHKKPCRPSPPSSGNLDQEVFLTIDVPDEKVLLPDFDLWAMASSTTCTSRQTRPTTADSTGWKIDCTEAMRGNVQKD